MKSKKSKTLAMKLIDDLLGDGDNDQEQSSKNSKKQAQDETIRVASQSDSDDDVLEINDSLFVDESNPFGISESLKPSEGEEAQPTSDKTIPMNETDETLKIGSSSMSSENQVKPSIGPNEKTQVNDNAVKDSYSFTGLTSSNIKASVGRYIGSGGVSSPTQTTLVQSENLRVAQQKILELEEEIARLRTNNEELAAAGETLKRVSDESKANQETLERKLETVKDLSEQEKQLMRDSIETKDRKIHELNSKIEEMELRLSTNIQKIRVRERELENRLELVRMEGMALARSKDELVLDLKRQIDQLNIELENYRSKGQELNTQLKDKQELLRRTVKALRLALSMLEGDEGTGFPLKKVK